MGLLAPYDHQVMAFEVCNMENLRLRQPRDDSPAQPLIQSPGLLRHERMTVPGLAKSVFAQS